MEQKELFNELPRPTFRWLGCNHLETALVSVPTNASTVTVSGDEDCLAPILDTDLMNDDFVGANKENLMICKDHFLSGFEIDVPEKAHKKVVLHSVLTEENPAEILRVRINVAKEGSLDLTVISESEGSFSGSFQMLTEVNGEEQSKIILRKVQLVDEKIEQVEHRYANLAEESDLKYVNVELGGKLNIYNYVTDILGEKANFDQQFGYLGDREQRFDISMLMTHIGKKSTSDVQLYGSLTGEAKKSFRGTLDFLRGCEGAQGNEEDTCLLMNEKVKSVSLPLLLCKEDNVVGNHAASVGQMDANKLFYLMTRGFSEEQARFILVESMLRPVIDQLGHEEMEEKALAYIQNKIHNS